MFRRSRLVVVALALASVGGSFQCRAAVNSSIVGGGLKIRVRTLTTGADIDSDGYLVIVARLGSRDSASVRIEANETRSFRLTGAGDYTVELAGIADNCTVHGRNPRAIDHRHASTTLELKCIATS